MESNQRNLLRACDRFSANYALEEGWYVQQRNSQRQPSHQE